MKIAKIMLIAIALIATAGGLLAFKAQRFLHKNVYCATMDAKSLIYCTSTAFKTVDNHIPHVSTPCITWHNALGLGATRTSTYYTTTTNGMGIACPNPLRATAMATTIN